MTKLVWVGTSSVFRYRFIKTSSFIPTRLLQRNPNLSESFYQLPTAEASPQFLNPIISLLHTSPSGESLCPCFSVHSCLSSVQPTNIYVCIDLCLHTFMSGIYVCQHFYSARHNTEADSPIIHRILRQCHFALEDNGNSIVLHRSASIKTDN